MIWCVSWVFDGLALDLAPWHAGQIERDHGAPSEAKEWEELVECACRLNLKDHWPVIESIVAGILHLGNIEFIAMGESGSEVSPGTAVFAKHAAELLGFTEERLRFAVTNHTIKIAQRGEQTSTPLSAARATDSRNGRHDGPASGSSG
jgi:myosin heavy subunit